MTSYEHKLKNAYIGEVYEYEYDFRGKSTAQAQADGIKANCDTFRVQIQYGTGRIQYIKMLVKY